MSPIHVTFTISTRTHNVSFRTSHELIDYLKSHNIYFTIMTTDKGVYLEIPHNQGTLHIPMTFINGFSLHTHQATNVVY